MASAHMRSEGYGTFWLECLPAYWFVYDHSHTRGYIQSNEYDNSYSATNECKTYKDFS